MADFLVEEMSLTRLYCVLLASLRAGVVGGVNQDVGIGVDERQSES